MKFFSKAALICVLLVGPLSAQAQKIAVIIPEKTDLSGKFAEKLETSLSAKFKVLDASLSEAAFRSVTVENVFNLTTDEAKTIGAAIGCDYFLLFEARNQRRAALSKPDYYESYAPVYVASARTGRLVFWKMQSLEAANPIDAEKLFLASTDALAAEIYEKLKIVSKEELTEKVVSKIEEVPLENTVGAKNFRPPAPFKRLKPEYTSVASLYRVTATVDILVDLDASGTITRREIVRWAGYGLDESVAETVRKMNWRAAERDGKFVPMRFLLRYNFKKIEKEED